MALNKNALIRYKAIDRCLQNTYKQWTLNDLIEACSDALYEYEGKEENVSKRTVQLDIQIMRSDKLGYNAPIVVYDRKYYKYDIPNYTITDIPLNETDMNVLSETVAMLGQFKDFSLFSELSGIIHRLEDKIYTEKNKQPAIIHLDKNEQLKGLEHLDTLYQAILKKMVLKINYQSFKAKEAQQFQFHPYLLKEFNNRWFVVGRKNEVIKVMTLALDRILKIDFDLSAEYQDELFDADAYYKHTFGVTVLKPEHIKEIELKIDSYNAPYMLTKPVHHSQKLLETYEDGSVRIGLHLHLNFELERLILGFGDGLEVLKPLRLRNRMIKKLKNSLANYGPF